MKNYIKIIFLIFLISILIFDDVLSYKIKSKSNIKDSNSSEDKQKRSEKNNLIKDTYNYITAEKLINDEKVNFEDYLAVDKNFKLITESNTNDSELIVKAKIVRNLMTEGWNRLSVESFKLKNQESESSVKTIKDNLNNPYLQMYLSGYIEGRLTNKDINNFYNNMIKNNTGKSSRSQSWEDIKSFFTKVSDNLLSKIKKGEKLIDEISTEYSQILSLGLFQILGLKDGYNYEAKDKFDLNDFLLIQADGEISELGRMLSYRKAPKNFRLGTKNYFKNAFGLNFESENKNEFYRRHFHSRLNIKMDRCSAMVKVLKDTDGTPTDLLVGHVTWSDYSEGIKYLKKYNFMFDSPVLNDNEIKFIQKDEILTNTDKEMTKIQAGVSSEKKCSDKKENWNSKPSEIIFSSYAGTLSSTDDFYISDKGLALTETTLDVFDLNLYSKAKKASDYIPNFMRVNSAIMFSSSACEWVNQFSKYNSGTYSSQWLVVDYNRFKRKSFRKKEVDEKYLQNEILYVLEQTPGSIVTHDISKTLLENSYYAGFNKAFFQETDKNLHSALFDELYGQDFSKQSPRSKIFNQLENNVNNYKEFKNVLMYNGYNRKGSVNEDPSYSIPADGISSRYDLGSGETAFGGTDFKMTSVELMKNNSLIAHHGPTTENNENLKIFEWDNFKYKENYSYVGVPSKFDFPFVKISSNTISSKTDAVYEFDDKK